MNIITGYRGEAHITADQIRDQNQGCFGDGSYILDVGSKLAATAISATSVQLDDGIISHQGCTASIPYGTTEAVTIGNGTQGMQRIDLIVARYTKDAGTGVEDMELAVIQGTPAASNPSVPAHNEGSIHAGDSPVDMPLFQVVLDGITIDEIVQVADTVKTQAETDAEISALNSSINDIEYFNCTDAGSYYDITRQNCYAIGKRVFISVELLVTTAAPMTSTVMFVVPSGYRPPSSLSGIGFVFRKSPASETTDLRPALVSVNSAGNVYQSLSSNFPLNGIVVIWAEYMRA